MIIDILPLVTGPIVKGAESQASSSSIRLWGRGVKQRRCGSCILIARLLRIDGEPCPFSPITPPANACHEHSKVPLALEHNYTGIVEFTDLDSNTSYIYEIGYYCINNKWLENSDFAFNWVSANRGTVRTAGEPGVGSGLVRWNFVFGSCRYHLRLGGKTLLGTGSNADRIYKSIGQHGIDFFLSIGDQVYLDQTGSTNRCTTLKAIRKKYDRVFGYEHFSDLLAVTPTYLMCDDHDLHRNDTNWAARTADPTGYLNALKVYREYQHIRGPTDTNCLYYTYDWNNATFFVMDTRSERDERTEINGVPRHPTMIGPGQFEALRLWIRDPKYQGYVKFLVSPTPFLSQTSLDSWHGFARQQRKVIELLMGEDLRAEPITNLFILTGDAHCARIGTYQISDSVYHMCELTEILSSGFVSMNHDHGKDYDKIRDLQIDPKVFDKDNDFPLVVDNTRCGGLVAKTTYASPSFPNPHKPTSLLGQARRLFTNAADNVFTNVAIDSETISIEIYNQDNKLLYERVFALEK